MIAWTADGAIPTADSGLFTADGFQPAAPVIQPPPPVIVPVVPDPLPDSYNIYVNGVFNQNVPNPLYRLAIITGLTPGVTYQIKVVAVSAGVEVAESDIAIAVTPTSVMIVTPMKRVWPFGTSGLN